LAAGDCGVPGKVPSTTDVLHSNQAGSVEEVWGKSMRRFLSICHFNLCHLLLLGTFSHLAAFSFIYSKTDKTHGCQAPDFHFARQST
jgi:hypothetical protein